MKINLSKDIISDKDYLRLFQRKQHIMLSHIESYYAFSRNLEVRELVEYIFYNHHIDIKPYLYSIKTLTSREYIAFLRYCRRYLSDEHLQIANVDSIVRFNEHEKMTPVEHMIRLFSSDATLMYAVIVIMQYYFL